MKKTILTIVFLALALCATAQEKTQEKAYKRDGNAFVETENKLMKGDQATTFVWRDKEGNEYPIILHTYTKGEKAGRTTAYVWRVSKKSGKEYRYYLPDGERIAEEIKKENEI